MKSEARMQPLHKIHEFQARNRMIYREKPVVYCNSAPCTAPSSPFRVVKNLPAAWRSHIPCRAQILTRPLERICLCSIIPADRSSTFVSRLRLTHRVFRFYLLRTAFCFSSFGVKCPLRIEYSFAGLVFKGQAIRFPQTKHPAATEPSPAPWVVRGLSVPL